MNALGLVLEQEGYQVINLTRPLDLANTNPDLVLIDGNSEGLTGYGSLSDLKFETGIDAPMYLFASKSDEIIAVHAEHLHADGYVSTEWGFRRLISVVRRAVRTERPAIPRTDPPDNFRKGMDRILVLDDHAGVRRRVVNELRNQGYAVEGCGDLPSFQATLASFDPDVIITDVVMPDIQGDDLCKELKHRMERMVPVLLMSSLDRDELKVRAERAGADAYVNKQDGMPMLIQKLEELLSEIVF